MPESTAFSIETRDGVLFGPDRRPVNVSRNAQGSIHDDQTAQGLGFRGGTVAGNIHAEQFPPLYEARFGETWGRRGGLSLYFLNATTDGEPVRAFAGPVQVVAPGLRRAAVGMETPAGLKVCEGTAWSGGDDPASALRQRLARQAPSEGLRILGGVRVGQAVRGVPSRLDPAACLERVQGITEPLSAYLQPDAQGRLEAAPAVAIDALRVVEAPLFRADAGFVGLFGAIELQYLDGPIHLGEAYVADGRVVALGESPKTEVAWYESTLRTAGEGRPVARLLMMSRLLKASSPLWT